TRSLAQDLPALGQAPGMTAADRQRIVRLLVAEGVGAVPGARERVEVTSRWAAGASRRHERVRPGRRYEPLAGEGRLVSRIGELRQGGRTLAAVAVRLNAEGFRPPKRSPTFNSGIVTRLLATGGRSGPRPHALTGGQLLGRHEWLLSDLARHRGMPPATRHRWIPVRWGHARQPPTPGGQSALWAGAAEVERMTRLRHFPTGRFEGPVRAELTKPTARDNN